MAKVSELKGMIVELKVDLLRAYLPDSCCPYRYFGNPTNKELYCNEVSCYQCKEDYFKDYENAVRKEIRKL